MLNFFYCFIILYFIFISLTSSTSSPNVVTLNGVSPTATRGMVIDAGSGGSRLHIYQWKARIFSANDLSKTVKNSKPNLSSASTTSSISNLNTASPLLVTPTLPLSYPEANEKWTARVDPGIHNFLHDKHMITLHLARLIDFAKVNLAGYEEEFSNFPIYFKATGGLRELPTDDREAIINEVRKLLLDKSFNPFYFQPDYARVISGEEEAVFSWAATNFLMGTLISNSQGQGLVQNITHTYGTLDLGGSSTQIAFFMPSQDIPDGLYKLQLGGQKQWNLYAKSFLKFGIVSARVRLMKMLADQAVLNYVKDYHKHKKSNKQTSSNIDEMYTLENITEELIHELELNTNTKQLTIENPCFHSGYTENYYDSTNLVKVLVVGPNYTNKNKKKSSLEDCRKLILPLMQKELNQFCDSVYHGECSIAGSFQPSLPKGDSHLLPLTPPLPPLISPSSSSFNEAPPSSILPTRLFNTSTSIITDEFSFLKDKNHLPFICTSSYKYPWKFLKMPQTSSLKDFSIRANELCSLSFTEMLLYYEKELSMNEDSDKLSEFLPYYCFLSSYIITLLEDGYGFGVNQTFTVVDEVNGHKVGWALGAILFEINDLPWELHLSNMEAHPYKFALIAASLGFGVGLLISIILYRECLDPNFETVSSQIQAQSTIANYDLYDFEKDHDKDQEKLKELNKEKNEGIYDETSSLLQSSTATSPETSKNVSQGNKNKWFKQWPVGAQLDSPPKYGSISNNKKEKNFDILDNLP